MPNSDAMGPADAAAVVATTPAAEHVMHDDSALLITLTRLEVKVDILLASSGDHEARLRAIESRGFISGKQLWAGLLGACGLMSGIAAVIALIIH